MNYPDWRDGYLRLHPQAALKKLELPFVYHIGKDELYEIDRSALDFLRRCNGSLKGSELDVDDDFITFCLDEELLEVLSESDATDITVGNATIPSLRYLELQLTHRCNLSCRHCYLGEALSDDLPFADALKIIRQFADRGGLRLLISGGEPMMYPHIQKLLAQTRGLPLRRILLTNGTLITQKNAYWIDVEEVQFSLDGWRGSHDMLRGPGSFDRVLKGIEAIRSRGIPISVATMVHRGNVKDFRHLKKFIRKIPAVEWGVDIPCQAGTLQEHYELMVANEEAVHLMKYAYGGGYHGSSDGYACGRHLMTVMPSGTAVKCGFYDRDPLGDACEDLMSCWLNLRHTALDTLECRDCRVLQECCGGCRFRAPSPLAPDPVMCALYGTDYRARG